MPWEVLDPATKHTIDMAVHAILIPGGERGKVLYFGGYDVNDTHTYDIKDRSIDPAAPLPGYNIFCAGHAILADGRILVAGGQLVLFDEQGNKIPPPEKPPEPEEGEEPEEDHAHPHYIMGWGGERHCSVYLPLTGAWVRVADLSLDPAENPNSGGRWYPALCTLANGEVLAVGGHPDLRELYPAEGVHRHNNNTPERYNPAADSWTLLASDPPAENQTTAHPLTEEFDYQRMHLLPSGLVFFSSPVRGKNRLYNAHQGRFLDDPVIDLPPLPADEHEAEHDGVYHNVSAAYTSVLLPLLHQENFRPRVLLMGGANAKRIDLGSPSTAEWENTVKRDWTQALHGTNDPPRRAFVLPVLLPTGEVFFTGGTSAHHKDDDAQALCVRFGETYDPGINWGAGGYTNAEDWTTTPDQAEVRRHYHAVAILLTDGSVWIAGSNGPSDDPLNVGGEERRVEIYTPPYFGQQDDRPVLSNVPKVIGYANTFRFNTTQANSISRVAFIRCGTVTHGFNMDQRYVSVDFTVINGTTIEVLVPFQPEVLPPGRYMLWVVNDQNLPCQVASFIRIALLKPYITLDFSTFAKSEIDAQGTPCNFDEAAHVVFDGFLPDEITTPDDPTIVWADDDDETVPGMSAKLGTPYYEGGVNNKDTAQRVVFPCKITFDNDDAFDSVTDFRDVRLRVRMREFTALATLTLSKKLNPRMTDGDPHWLSLDLRAFSVKPGEQPYAGVEHPSGGGAPFTYIQSLLAEFNNRPDTPDHPFEDLPTDQATNVLPLYSHEEIEGEEVPVYNYAVARVRFRAPLDPDIVASNVRVFFRLWTTGWTALEYDKARSYRAHDFNSGANAIPLLGLTGDEINNVPCFAEAREADMKDQQDLTNRKDLTGTGADEVWTFFGCWLDFNQDDKRFPLKPGDGTGPFNGELKSIQELMRGLHQCLVAEIHYVPDDIIKDGATPASSDSLAQRNLLLDDSDNPGGFGAHIVHHTFEIKPSPFRLPRTDIPSVQSASVSNRMHPDELVIDWGNLPRDSHATLYFPQVDADDVLRYASQRPSPGNLKKVDAHTISCKVTDVGFVPIPGPSTTAFPALITIQLPPDIHAGQKFTVVLRQVDGRRLRVLGTTQFDIRVKTAPEILPRLTRNLSVLRHIALSIPEDNRWHPVFTRYVTQTADRVRALGGNPDEVAPSPTGSGTKVGRKCRLLGGLFASLLALVFVALGLRPAAWAGPLAAVGAVLLVAVALFWFVRCKPSACALIYASLVGAVVGGAVLGLVALLGYVSTTLITVLAVVAVIGGLLILAALLRRCCVKC